MKAKLQTEVKAPVELEQLPSYPPVALKLWEARQWLSDEKHWWKGGMGSREEGSTCALGALGWIDQEYPEESDIRWQATTYMKPAPCYVAFYNDAAATTHADILALFDHAIELALVEGK